MNEWVNLYINEQIVSRLQAVFTLSNAIPSQAAQGGSTGSISDS